jgi:hypothetical protein
MTRRFGTYNYYYRRLMMLIGWRRLYVLIQSGGVLILMT